MRNRLAIAAKNKKGFTLVETIVTLVIAGIFMAITIGILISTTNLSAHAEKNLSAKQITTEVLEFLVEQTKYATEITPVASSDAVSADAYTMPTSDKIYNEKWPNPNPWIVDIGIDSDDYDDLTTDEEKLAFYNALTDPQKQAVSDESYTRNLIFYVGSDDDEKEKGTPVQKGYLFFKRADDRGDPINVFGKAYYGNRRISLDVSEIQDSATSKIVVTATVTLWEGEEFKTKTYAIHNSFELVNTDTTAEWTTENDIAITGSDDPPCYYICKDVKYFDW
jgi:prepilin-type N-terminal cleavage/methylation domain-containing protein